MAHPLERIVTGARLSGYGMAYFFAAGAFMSYWPVWLKDRGMSDAEIGTLFMSRQLVAIATTLAVGWLAHRLGNVRGVLLSLAAIGALMMSSFEFAYGFLAILAVSLVWGAVWAPTLALYDSVLVTETKVRGFNYSSLRVWGSVAFIAGTLLCAVAVDRNGPSWILYVGLSGVVLLIPLALWLPPAAEPLHERAHAPFGILDLLRSPQFLLFLVATGCCQASHAVLYSFGTLTWRAAGIDDVTIGLLWNESVALEILLMLAGGWLLKRLGVCGLIALGLGCALVRWIGMAFTTELWALVLLQALHAGSFGACHLGAMAFLQRALPANGAALAQSVYYALGTGVAQAVIYQASGVLYAEYGQKAFLGMLLVAAVGMVAIVVLGRIWTGGLVVSEVGRTNATVPVP
jgi:PPP family 3-phenylpropionic acid transporter